MSATNRSTDHYYFLRTLVYLEGDATMRTYEDADGKKQSSLSLVQTKVEVLKRPQPKEADTAGEVFA